MESAVAANCCLVCNAKSNAPSALESLATRSFAPAVRRIGHGLVECHAGVDDCLTVAKCCGLGL